MNLETLIYQALTTDAALTSKLTLFEDIPAVFELLAPENQALGWNGKQTPRVEYWINREEDPERRVSGQVSVSVLHEDTSNATAAEIEDDVRRLLDGATFRPDGETITLQWHTVELYDDNAEFRGFELVFDLIAWPIGLTYAPDPVKALRMWSDNRWSALQVDPQTWSPTDSTPALYWRLSQIDNMEMESWGAWMTGRFYGHLLAKTPNVRIHWLRSVAEGLSIDRAVPLEDGSRLFIERIAASSDADPLREGQITVTARFGVLSSRSGTLLTKVYIDGNAGKGRIEK